MGSWVVEFGLLVTLVAIRCSFRLGTAEAVLVGGVEYKIWQPRTPGAVLLLMAGPV